MRERGKEPGRGRSRSAADVVIGVLDEQPDATTVEIAAAVGLGRSTVSAALARLESAGKVKRSGGGREGARSLPDRWRLSRRRARKSRPTAEDRLRPGELDELVLRHMREHAKSQPLGPTAVANTLGRSSGAVANCLKRLAKTDKLRQTNERPLRYQHGRPR
jgi:DNA-binding transcriptional ArsR family regulator